jgi:RHS repeat-associated protein
MPRFRSWLPDAAGVDFPAVIPTTTHRRKHSGRRMVRHRVCASEKRCTGIFRARTGHRFYNPDTGRWLSKDPITERGFKNVNFPLPALLDYVLNSYLFVENRGTGDFDILGLVGSTQAAISRSNPCGNSAACQSACAAAPRRPGLHGIVMCTPGGQKCPCVLGYSGSGIKLIPNNKPLEIGDCPELDKVICAHEKDHIQTHPESKCNPDAKKPHPSTCGVHSKEEHLKRHCGIWNQDLERLRKAKDKSSAACKYAIEEYRLTKELGMKSKCKKWGY